MQVRQPFYFLFLGKREPLRGICIFDFDGAAACLRERIRHPHWNLRKQVRKQARKPARHHQGAARELPMSRRGATRESPGSHRGATRQPPRSTLLATFRVKVTISQLLYANNTILTTCSCKSHHFVNFFTQKSPF